MLRVLLAGGGTAGHVNPALAIAEIIKKHYPDAEISFAGNPEKLEARLVPAAGYKFYPIKIEGFQRKPNWVNLKRNIHAAGCLVKSGSTAKKIIKEAKPDLVIGTGGYVSGPIVRKAAKMGIKTAIHEQNAFPGVTNKMLSKHADRVMLAIEDAKRHMDPNASFTVTGNPVRGQIVTSQKQASRDYLRLDNRPVILSFGGSLGARKINEAAADLIAWSSRDDRFQHIHAYGQYGKWFPELLEKKGVDLKAHKNLDIREYINNMPVCMAAADLVICRAGAITLTEIQAQGKASLLIPSPNVAENHQYHNAMALVSRNAAEILEEKDLTGDSLIAMVKKMISDPIKLKEYQDNARAMAILDSSERIYQVIKEVLKKNQS